MNITLKIIAESEEICRKFNSQDKISSEDKVDYDFLLLAAKFVRHSRTMLPATLKLVREMYQLIKVSSDQGCRLIDRGRDKCPREEPICIGCKSRRLVERMEEEDEK